MQAIAVLLDLDGTLIDSNYQHALAWREALSRAGFDVPTWKIHRRIGMSGELLANELSRQLGVDLSVRERVTLLRAHAESFARRVDEVQPLPGANDLLHALDAVGAQWAIATSGSPDDAAPGLKMLDVSSSAHVLTSQPDEPAKPDPAIFLRAANTLGDVAATFVVGDSIWDMLAARRAGFLGVGVLTGGSSRSQLVEAGAYRVFEDTDEIRLSLDLLGLHSDVAAP